MLKKIFNHILILTLFSLLPIKLMAQDLRDYEDVYNSAQSGSKEKAFYSFTAFQKNNPRHANVYYQLALISLDWAKSADPLTDYSEAKLHIYNTKLYLGLCKLYIDEKDVRQNREFYQHINPSQGEKKIELVNVTAFIDQKLEEIKYIEDNVTSIHNAFEAASKHYNFCIDKFMSINNRNSKIKDIYLTADKSLTDEALSIKTSFDSTTYYFDAYKKAIQKYPVKNYKQDYSLKEIETYRLEGLTDANFLYNKVELWNFAKWVDELLKTLNVEIAGLREDISKADREQKQLIASLEADTESYDEFVAYSLPVILQNKINKYDYQSVVLAMFQYREAKINFLKKCKLTLNTPAVEQAAPLLRKARYYQDLTEAKHQLDSLNAVLVERTVPRNTAKHQELISNYGGTEGLANYAKEEQMKNNNLFEKAVDNLKLYILASEKGRLENEAVVTYKNEQIPLKISNNSFSAEAKGYKTKHIRYNTDSSYYITGSYTTDLSTVAFVALTAADNKVIWLNTIDLAAAQQADYGMALEVSQGNCFLLISSISAANPQLVNNTMLSYDKSGKVTGRFSLSATGVARYLSYNEITGNLVAAFYGASEQWYDNENQEAEVLQLDTKALVKWSSKFNMKGELLDIVRMNDNLLVFANYSALDTEGKKIEVQQNGTALSTGLFSVMLNQEGKIEKTSTYPSEEPYQGIKVIKLSSNHINIIGLRGPAGSSLDDNSLTAKHYYLLTDSQGNQVYSNIQ
jgi:hypothetical protein